MWSLTVAAAGRLRSRPTRSTSAWLRAAASRSACDPPPSWSRRRVRNLGVLTALRLVGESVSRAAALPVVGGQGDLLEGDGVLEAGPRGTGHVSVVQVRGPALWR
jgi:hypothetical protein